jgi:DNA-binding transcriptional regulator YiaG
MAKLIDCDSANNAELKVLRADLNLHRQMIATIARVSKSLVDSWLVKPDSQYFRPMPGKSLRLMKLELGIDPPGYRHLPKEAQKRSEAIKGV